MTVTARAASRRATARQAPAEGAGWRFLRGFLKHPVMVGSVIPSSRVLVERMLEPVDWHSCALFVEYGPGVGTFTRPILERLRPGASLLAIDTNPDFVSYLRRSVHDPRLEVVRGSASDVREILGERGLGQADYVLSGLPFSTLPAGVGARIANETAAALTPGGAFLVYQYSPKVRTYLEPNFARIDRAFEWRNFPPVTLYWAWKD
jgi:phospholipid N-methyltransferase